MSTVYSKRFLAARLSSGATSPVVPAGKVWVLRDVSCIHGAAAAGEQLLISLGNGGPNVLGFLPAPGAPAANYRWTGNQVFYAGEVIYINASGVWDIFLSGYEFVA